MDMATDDRKDGANLSMTEHRCFHCNKLLFLSTNLQGTIDIKCPRCGRVVRLSFVYITNTQVDTQTKITYTE